MILSLKTISKYGKKALKHAIIQINKIRTKKALSCTLKTVGTHANIILNSYKSAKLYT